MIFCNVCLIIIEEIMSLMCKFNVIILFNDELIGFYGIVREIFEYLVFEEEVVVDFVDVDSFEYLIFGFLDDDYEIVVKFFYSVWLGFLIMKLFFWKDKYCFSDVLDCWVR